MTEQRKAGIIELFDGAKDQNEQIKLMTKMGFGTRGQILKVLQESGRMGNKKIQAIDEKEQNDRRKEPERLPMPQDVKELLIDELDGIENSIKELQQIIREKEEKVKKLEDLYRHIVEALCN